VDGLPKRPPSAPCGNQDESKDSAMKNRFTVSWRRFSMVVALCLLVGGRPADAAVSMGSLDVSRILFLGNSITYHPALPSIGWYNNWGMAASAEDKDYVHVLTTAISALAGATPQVMVKNIFTFEDNYTGYDIPSSLAAELAFEPTVLVLAIGENVTLSSTADINNYAAACTDLLETFKASSGPVIFTRSCFWGNATKDAVMQAVTAAAGGTYVDIGALGLDPLNYAYSEPTYASNNVINGHPGDRGMAAIADAMLTSMVAQSVPEPSSIALCAGAVLALLFHARARHKRQSM
jgi:hypothetical protein